VSVRPGPAGGPRVAVLGGGTGLSTLLSGLKSFTRALDAVVTVTDEGGSSGRLRRAWGVIPPGDLRNCLAALSEDGTLLSRLLQYRFPVEDGRNGTLHSLGGHAFGNLLLMALSDVAGGLDRALVAASRVLAVRGRVHPASLERVRLLAHLAGGRRVIGETRISRSPARIQRVALVPASPAPAPGVLAVLEQADVIVLGPGSLYTSVIPPLLVRGVAAALARSRALKVYVCNVMTQPGETQGFSAEDHLEAVMEHCPRADGRPPVDAMVVNDRPFPPAVLRHYGRFRAFPIAPPRAESYRGVRIVRRALVPAYRGGAETLVGQARHSPAGLARAVMALHAESRSRRRAARLRRGSPAGRRAARLWRGSPVRRRAA
jgi:uncharacterized cofD-like protein